MLTAADLIRHPALPFLLTAVISALWAVVEVVSAFEYAPFRALRTGGALLLIVFNAAAACLALALVAEVPGMTVSLATAVGVALGWQAFLRARVNLLQPLPGSQTEAVGVSITDLYARFQKFCRRQIDRALVGERLALLESALQLDLDDLVQRTRLLSHALITDTMRGVDDYVKRMEERGLPEEERKLLLAAFLLENGGPAPLRELTRKRPARKRERQPSTGEPPQ